MSRRLSTTPCHPSLMPRQVKPPPAFPLGTLLYAQKDGREVAFIARTRFLKKFKPGEPMPTVFVLLGSDFRTAKALFEWLGPGATVQIYNGGELPETIAAVAQTYGEWNAPNLVIRA